MNGNSAFVENVRILMVKGEKGSSIQSITKTGTSGAVDTYTITMTDGSTSTFEVTNGTPIQSIVLTSSDDVYDYYTLTDSAGNTATFKVQNHDKDIADFEAEVNAILDNAPYIYYVEDEDFELPVNTINDSVTALNSAWSSRKTADEIDSRMTNLDNEIDDLWYKPGDVETTTGVIRASAYFGAGKDSIYFTLPLCKPVRSDVVSVSVSASINRLVDGSTSIFTASNNKTFPSTTISVTVQNITPFGIEMGIKLSSPNSSITEYSTGQIALGNLSVTFS